MFKSIVEARLETFLFDCLEINAFLFLFAILQTLGNCLEDSLANQFGPRIFVIVLAIHSKNFSEFSNGYVVQQQVNKCGNVEYFEKSACEPQKWEILPKLGLNSFVQGIHPRDFSEVFNGDRVL